MDDSREEELLGRALLARYEKGYNEGYEKGYRVAWRTFGEAHGISCPKLHFPEEECPALSKIVEELKRREGALLRREKRLLRWKAEREADLQRQILGTPVSPRPSIDNPVVRRG